MQESTFAVFQMLSIYHWAKLSDIVGRRPVVLVGSIGMGVMTLLFGLSQNLTSVMITRSLNGLFAGNIAVVQSVLGEISDSSNQAITFPIYAMIWPMGAILG
jgi:MFS family permease